MRFTIVTSDLSQLGLAAKLQAEGHEVTMSGVSMPVAFTPVVCEEYPQGVERANVVLNFCPHVTVKSSGVVIGNVPPSPTCPRTTREGAAFPLMRLLDKKSRIPVHTLAVDALEREVVSTAKKCDVTALEVLPNIAYLTFWTLSKHVLSWLPTGNHMTAQVGPIEPIADIVKTASTDYLGPISVTLTWKEGTEFKVLDVRYGLSPLAYAELELLTSPVGSFFASLFQTDRPVYQKKAAYVGMHTLSAAPCYKGMPVFGLNSEKLRHFWHGAVVRIGEDIHAALGNSPTIGVTTAYGNTVREVSRRLRRTEEGVRFADCTGGLVTERFLYDDYKGTVRGTGEGPAQDRDSNRSDDRKAAQYTPAGGDDKGANGDKGDLQPTLSPQATEQQS